MSKQEITYRYIFEFPDGSSKEFEMQFDPVTFILHHTDQFFPEWTRLSNHRCSCCPLDPEKTKFCPIAGNISDLVHAFTNTASYKSCKVSCKTAERTCSKDTTVQDGLSSIMGVIMATSGCPIMALLKPMARFHLPFSTVDETMFRSVSVYLLGQYFKQLSGKPSDFSLEKMHTYYSEIEKVNDGILARIRGTTEMDADKNAIIILNSLAQILVMEINDNMESLQYLFK